MASRDLMELTPETVDIPTLYRKISAGAEMKTAIKRFLSEWEKRDRPSDSKLRKRLDALREAMEDWCNLIDSRL